ncbi:MAG: right-handed parallel beta-helix repeat-containing protein [Gemmataceae bacterium]|nr:right-handed parallel beta-helix repeat-containing protein [Gemmataceae bacterium]
MIQSRIRRATMAAAFRPRLDRLEARDVPAIFTVINTNASGPGSLDAAINSANISADPLDFVHFNIPVVGVATIQPLGPLPIPASGVTIDGRTQPGWSANNPVIEIDGSLAGISTNGLNLSNNNVEIRDLIINRFGGNGINVFNATNTTVAGCWIGLNKTGNAIAENGGLAVNIAGTLPTVSFTLGGSAAADRNVVLDDGAAIISGTDVAGPVIRGNFIGTDRFGILDLTANAGPQSGIALGGTAGKFTIAGNVISGLASYGIAVDTGAKDSVITGNFIGLASDGVTQLRNGDTGIVLNGAVNFTVGGTATTDRNVIATNGYDDGTNGSGAGIILTGTASGNTILGNYLGCDSNGLTFSGLNYQAYGVQVSGSASNNTIGGTAAGAGNVFAGNGHTIRTYGAGVFVTGAASGTNVFGNYFGVLANLTTKAANLFHGAEFAGTGTGNVFGGTGAGQGNFVLGNGSTYGSGVRVSGENVTIRGNVISGSKNGGIQLDGAKNIAIGGNTVGLGADGVTVVANNGHGIDGYNGCSTISIGGTALADRNIFSSNDQGIRFDGGNTFSIVNNYFGVDKTGSLDLGNKGSGILLVNTNTVSIVGNLTSGNGGDGIALDNSSLVTITGNIAGMDATGTNVINNSFSGVAMFNGSNNVTIGGPLVSDRNLLSGNGTGVYIGGSGSQLNVVQNNYIGVDKSGAVAAGNTFRGLWLDGAPNNTIVGNVISASTNEGLVINSGSGSGNSIKGNLIGTDATGTIALGNGQRGIGIYSAANNLIIGGTGVGEGNVISGNKGSGIEMYDAGTSNITIQGNFIGTDKSGAIDLGNAFNGIVVSNVSTAFIGGVGAGEGNTIAFNKAAGIIVVDNTLSGLIRGNSIYSNVGLGIDLGANGVTANDALDPDLGPNLLQNFPVLTSATAGASTTVIGSVNSTASTALTIDFYANPTGTAQGKRYLGSTNVTTDGAGNASFNVNTLASSTAGEAVTAVAIDPAGNTSEFSAAVTTPGAAIPAKVTNLVINNGATQRSRVLSIRIEFSQIVTFTGGLAGAFQLNKVGGGSVTFDTVNSVIDNSGSGTKVTFAFALTGPTDGAVGSVSLADGRYILTANAANISNANGNLDGNGDGTGGDNYNSPSAANSPPTVAPTGIFRLFGDADGNGQVNSSDFLNFRLAFLSSDPTFDFNGNGSVDSSDFLAFRINFLKVIV